MFVVRTTVLRLIRLGIFVLGTALLWGCEPDGIASHSEKEAEQSRTAAEGIIGNAIKPDGDGEYFELDEVGLENATDFTIASWLYQNRRVMWARFFDFAIDYQAYMSFAPYDTNNKACFVITKVGSYDADTVCTEPVPAQKWAHVALLSGFLFFATNEKQHCCYMNKLIALQGSGSHIGPSHANQDDSSNRS
jgi:hypothetical protein